MGLLDFILIFIVVFFLSIGFLLLRQKQTEWLHSCSEKLGTLCFPAVFIAGAVTFITGVFYLGYNITWLDISPSNGQWDYLNALATIIGAGISLIPIFWLIGQNKLIRAQMQQDKEGLERQLKSQKEQNELIRVQLDLQQKQNNADAFTRAHRLCSDKNRVSFYIGLNIFETLIAEEDGKYIELMLLFLKEKLLSANEEDQHFCDIVMKVSEVCESCLDYTLGRIEYHLFPYNEELIQRHFKNISTLLFYKEGLGSRLKKNFEYKQYITAKIHKWKSSNFDLSNEQKELISELEKLLNCETNVVKVDKT